MGKGDRRSRRGKLFRGTFGVTRKHKVGKPVAAASTAKVSTPEVSTPEAGTEAPKKKAPKKKKEE